MIARHWRGLAKSERAAEYIQHLRSDTFPNLSTIAGFIDAAILRRTLDAGIEFVIVTRWKSLDAIRAFAGADVERAVVPDVVKEMLIEYDSSARHYEVLG
jgi:heme-degrading monooxygenase HmoA